MKRLLAITTLLAVLTETAVYAADYSAQLTELETLMAQCESRNISVPYETVGTETFKRFKAYLAKDEENGVSSEIMAYNDSAMQNLYATTKSNLEAYLNGTKTPYEVPSYNMMRTSVSGTGITDGKNNIISSGYGHFETVQNDIEKMSKFGMTNIQMETGPKNIIAIPDWKYSVSGSPEYSFDITEDEGNRVFKVIYDSEKADGKYFCIKQSVTVEPSTRYVYKLSYKGTNVDSSAPSIKINGGSLSKFDIASVSASWQETSWRTFTTGANDTSITFEVYVTDKCEELFVDDIVLRKYSGGDNLLSNGDFEAAYSLNEIGRIQSILERAKRSNVAVSFLLQPLYFWRVSGCEDMYSSATGTSYNIKAWSLQQVHCMLS